jgi:polysaccharide pyruvyl transferase WcaK-like protein
LAPNAVSPQVFDMALAIQAQKKLILWSQSIGPLEFSSTKDADFIRSLLVNAAAICTRDKVSVSELEGLGGVFRVHETLESVIGLTPLDREHIPPEERSSVLGISIYTTKKRSEDAHKKYVHTMAALVDHAVRCGLTPKFFPMALKGSGADDRPTIHQIISRSQFGDKSLVVDQDLPTLAHMREISKCKAFVGHKTHSIVFSLVSATPVLAIAYHQKACDFMSQFGLSDYCLADVDLTQERVVDLLEEVLANLEDISNTERDNASDYATRVRSDFASILQI